MTVHERLIYRGYLAEANDRGDDLGGGAADDTADKKDGKEEEAVIEKEEKEEKKPEPTIPKSRFDQALAKARKVADDAFKRAEEAEAKLLKQTGSVDEAKLKTEIADLDEKLDAAMADNNKEAIKLLRSEIRERMQDLSDSRASQRANYAAAVAIEQTRYDALVEKMETQHPELNPEDDEFDEDKVAEIMDLKSGFEAKGDASSAALTKAIKYVYKGEGKKEEKEDEAAKRKEAAVKKGLDTKKAQPSDKKVGVDSNKAGKTGSAAKDVLKLSDKDFETIAKEDLSAARGDTYVPEE